MNKLEARLVLSDGTTFRGELYGYLPPNGLVVGEIVTNTAMSGYLETITDPASSGQIINFSYPQIGNVGASAGATMSNRGGARGIVVRELIQSYSNWQADQSLEEAMLERSQAIISGVDTRRLTRQLHTNHAMTAAFGTASDAELRSAAQEAVSQDDSLVAQVTTSETHSIGSEEEAASTHRPKIVVIDLGVRSTTVQRLAKFASVTLVPAHTSAADIKALSPDGVVLSSGPGNPAVLAAVVQVASALANDLPILAIGLGSMVLAQVLGASIKRLERPHYGANIPVRRLSNRRVEITSQNRSFGIVESSLDEALITYRNLNDGEIEGFRSADGTAVGVAYNPDLGPGAFDSDYLFDDFAKQLNSAATSPKGN